MCITCTIALFTVEQFDRGRKRISRSKTKMNTETSIQHAIETSIVENRTVDLTMTEDEFFASASTFGLEDYRYVDGYLDAWGTTESGGEWRLRVIKPE